MCAHEWHRCALCTYNTITSVPISYAAGSAVSSRCHHWICCRTLEFMQSHLQHPKSGEREHDESAWAMRNLRLWFRFRLRGQYICYFYIAHNNPIMFLPSVFMWVVWKKVICKLTANPFHMVSHGYFPFSKCEWHCLFKKWDFFSPFRTLKLLEVKMIRSITVLDKYHLFFPSDF